MEKQIFELTYGASIVADGNKFLVTFRDLSNVFTCGTTHEEAIFNAVEALDGVLLEMVVEDLEIPLPSDRKSNEEAISVSPEIAAPVMLHALRKDSSHTILYQLNNNAAATCRPSAMRIV